MASIIRYDQINPLVWRKNYPKQQSIALQGTFRKDKS